MVTILMKRRCGSYENEARMSRETVETIGGGADHHFAFCSQ